MKVILLAFLSIILMTSDAFDIDPAKDDDINTMVTAPEQKEEADLEQSELSEKRRSKQCWVYYSYGRYKNQLKKMGLKRLPYHIRIAPKRAWKRPRKPRYYCTRRSSRNKGLCATCWRLREVNIHPSVNAMFQFNEVRCQSSRCLNFGRFSFGKCAPVINVVYFPVPKGCNGVILKPFKLKVGCCCKSNSPYFRSRRN